jgi:hypothetical protein
LRFRHHIFLGVQRAGGISWKTGGRVISIARQIGSISLGEDFPKLWGAATAVERKHILRLVIKEVILDQRPASGQV